MPKEARQITFKNNEVIDALCDFCRQTDRDLPTEQLSALSFANDSQITVFLHHTDKDIPPSTFTQSETAVALIKYCNSKRIPIQKKATKWLEVKEDHLVLSMTARRSWRVDKTSITHVYDSRCRPAWRPVPPF